MTPQQFLDQFRDMADDHNDPPLWSDALVLAYGSEGEMEAARRTRYLEDSTSSLCEIDIEPGEPLYELDARIIFVRRVKLESQRASLPKINRKDLERCRPEYESDDNGEPCAWVRWDQRSIRIVPPPETATVAHLTVIREPLEDLSLDPEVGFEMPRRYQPGILNYALHKAYLHRERQDMYRPEESAARLAMFEAEFGKKSTAVDEAWIEDNHGFDDYEGLR